MVIINPAMLHKSIRDEVSNATVRIVANGGSGVLVPGSLIITAAHCIEWNCTGAMAAWSGPRPLVEIRTHRGQNFLLEPYAVEPCSDIAVLGPADRENLAQDCAAFDEFCQSTKPVTVSAENFQHNQELEVHICGSRMRWVTGTAIQRAPFPLWTYVETSEEIAGGFSGGPIVTASGQLVGIVSWSGGTRMPNGKFSASFTRPHLALPTWICSEIFGKASNGG